MIQNLLFRILFLKILSRAYNFFMYVPVDIIRIVLNIRFSNRNSKSQQKLAIKITHFTIYFFSKQLTHFTNLNSLDAENNMLPQHSENHFWFRNFPENMFLFGVSKNICTAPFFVAQDLHSWITLRANVCIFLYIII